MTCSIESLNKNIKYIEDNPIYFSEKTCVYIYVKNFLKCKLVVDFFFKNSYLEILLASHLLILLFYFFPHTSLHYIYLLADPPSVVLAHDVFK